MKAVVTLLLLTAIFSSRLTLAQTHVKACPEYLQPWHALDAINVILVHDVVSPPVAGRYYAYCMLGAYTIIAQHNKTLPPLQRFIKSYKSGNISDTIPSNYDYRVAAYYSILEVARQLLPSGYQMENNETSFVALLKSKGLTNDLIKNSIKVAETASENIINFSKSDHYRQLSALKRYTPLKEEGKWYPTPPGYFEAVEPNWRTIRTMVIDSASQFKPAPLIPFSKDTASAFYKQVLDVYTVSKHLTPDQSTQALFWDCNPFAITTSGHMSIGFKKISPGGHWMNIAGLVSKQAQLSFDQSVIVLTLEGVTLMDAFISCWEEKYHSNRIRPETFINRYMDIKWQPVLQTPPFPEYTSGHAVISHASAELLTYLLGNNFKYNDDTEIPYGSGERSFTSFRQAAEEASVSRFYGGIHYRQSIENGNVQGNRIGTYVVKQIRKAGIRPLYN